MAFLTFLNELSYPTGQLTQSEARQFARTLIGVLRDIKTERNDLALHSSVSLPNIPLGEGIWLSSLRADAESLDEWRFLRGLENRAPFHVGLEQEVDGSVDYEFNDRSAVGLGLAHNFDAVAVSFDAEPWFHSSLAVNRIELGDDGIFDTEVVTVRNASNGGHVNELRPWARLVRIEEPADGHDLWTNRIGRFPRLRFLPRVEAQLRGLKSGTAELSAINRRLYEIQTAATEWNIANEPFPPFRSKASPEYEGRRAMFDFADLDGHIRCFDVHLRYTPGAGRIHMWCVRSDGTVSIGYVGEKVQ